ncbi:MAG: hypothetical protein HYZ50_20315 [Deltaproteobacteria bacterium]|nr:hypothetical protein [Deltaproteobacteria bacterium]
MQFAKKLGLHWNTVARFERDELTISGPVAKLAQLFLEIEETTKNSSSEERNATEDRIMKKSLRKKRKEE